MARLLLFDGSAYLYRAFYALPPLKTSDGFPTGAIYGFLKMLLAALRDYDARHAAVVFDAARKSFRSEMYAAYKSQRRPMDDELKKQIPILKKLLRLLGVPLLEVEGVEADDVIASLAAKFSKKSWEVIVLSPDKDLAALLSFEGVRLVNPVSGEEITRQKVLEKFGVEPEQIPSYLALVGDRSDNVPGVEGVGPKRAVKILERYKSVENLLKEWESLDPKTAKALSKTTPEELKRWLELVTLKTDLKLEVEERDLRLSKPSPELKEELRRLEMNSLIPQVEKLSNRLGPYQPSLF